MGGKIIETRHAEVQTATVEIKALTVSGKQVTLSMFRQLVSEQIVELDGQTLTGEPWGLVNYFFGECKPNHLHIVWQKGGELRRACVFKQPWVTYRDGFPLDYELVGDMPELAKDIRKRARRSGADPTGDSAELLREFEQFRQDYSHTYDRLATLPQLFIAT